MSRFGASVLRIKILVLVLPYLFGLPCPILNAKAVPVLEISTAKDKYLLGEPIYLDIVLRNSGDRAFRFIDYLTPEAQIIRIYIELPDRRQLLYNPPLKYEVEGVRTKLEQGEFVYSYGRIFLSSFGPTFSLPGRYRIFAQYDGFKKPRVVTSNEIQVEFVEPSTLSEIGAFEQINGGEQVLYLYFLGGDHLKRGIKKLAVIAKKHRKTDYGHHVNLAFGVAYSQDFGNKGRYIVRPAKPRKSLRHLKKARDRRLSSFELAKKYAAMIRSYRRLDMKRKAGRVERKYYSKYGGQPARQLFEFEVLQIETDNE